MLIWIENLWKSNDLLRKSIKLYWNTIENVLIFINFNKTNMFLNIFVEKTSLLAQNALDVCTNFKLAHNRQFDLFSRSTIVKWNDNDEKMSLRLKNLHMATPTGCSEIIFKSKRDDCASCWNCSLGHNRDLDLLTRSANEKWNEKSEKIICDLKKWVCNQGLVLAPH